MQVVNKCAPEFLYQQVIGFVHDLKHNGSLRPGDKLPSLRKLSKQLDISVPTVKQAYVELERQGVINAKPQSGYYLKAQTGRTLLPTKSRWHKVDPCSVACRTLIEKVYDAVHYPNTVPLGISNPVQAHPTDKTLARMMRGVISKVADKAVSYGPPNGDIKLRTLIALRYQENGTRLSPDDILITNGAQEALAIALQSVATKGDIIAVESPTFFGILELIESLGMKALELYSCSEDGVCIEEMQKSLAQYDVKACIFSSVINNPLGSKMTNEQRSRIVRLLEDQNIPIVEDEAYSELYFEGERPKPFQQYSEKGLVITCGSFSKTAAPGYRLGYISPGRWQQKAKQLKRALSASTSMLPQWTLCEYLQSGEYDRHLSVLRKRLAYNCERMRSLVAEHFPSEVCISKPKGGNVLWIRCRSQVHTEDFFDEAIENGVSFAPGAIFSPSGKYHNYMRLSFGVHWCDEIETAIKNLGKLVFKAQDKLK